MSNATNLEFDWGSYYAAVAQRPPRHTLVRTLTRLDREQRSPSDTELTSPHHSPPYALDLGCGSGRDTQLLLERGWKVLAIDAESQAIATLTEQVQCLNQRDPNFGRHLAVQVCSYENIPWPTSLQLVNASFSLPFCPPEHFAQVWHALQNSLQPQGWFCGQFFGDRDEWSIYANIFSLSRLELMDLFAGAEIIELEEEEYDGHTALGTPKHWHIFHVIARFASSESLLQ